MLEGFRTSISNMLHPPQRGLLGISANDPRVGDPRHIMLVFLVLALPFTWFAIGETDKNFFGRVYDARVVDKQEYAGRKRTTYHIRYQYIEDGVTRESSDRVDYVTYHRITIDAPSSPAKGKAKVGKVLGFYFDEYFQGDFHPDTLLVAALIFGSILANVGVFYFLLKLRIKPTSPSNEPTA